MAEYIEREAALDSLLIEMCGSGYQSRAMSAIGMLPAADVAPVRHGRWIERRIPRDTGTLVFVCSACGGKPEWMKRNYCPNCGARMDKECEQ